MWLSHNFLQYNGTIMKIKVNEWINNLKKNMLRQSPPPSLGMHIIYTNYNNLTSKQSKRF